MKHCWWDNQRICPFDNVKSVWCLPVSSPPVKSDVNCNQNGKWCHYSTGTMISERRCQPTIWSSFLENCMKMEELFTQTVEGGGAFARPVALPKFATALVASDFRQLSLMTNEWWLHLDFTGDCMCPWNWYWPVDEEQHGGSPVLLIKQQADPLPKWHCVLQGSKWISYSNRWKHIVSSLHLSERLRFWRKNLELAK